MNGFKSFDLEVFDTTACNDTDILAIQVATINNPSPIEMIPAGVLSFGLDYDGTQIGTVATGYRDDETKEVRRFLFFMIFVALCPIRDQCRVGRDVFFARHFTPLIHTSTLHEQFIYEQVNLTKGLNRIQLLGSINPQSKAQLDATNKLMGRWLSNEDTTVISNSDEAEATSIALFKPALHGLTIDVTLKGNSTPLIKSVEVQSASMAPKDNKTASMSLYAHFKINNPLGQEAGINMSSVSNISAGVFDSNGTKLGSITIRDRDIPVTIISAPTDAEDWTYGMSLDNDLVMEGQGEAFADWLYDFVMSETVSMTLNGTATVTATVAAWGPSKPMVMDVPLVMTAALPGYQGLQNIEVLSSNVIEVIGAGANKLSRRESDSCRGFSFLLLRVFHFSHISHSLSLSLPLPSFPPPLFSLTGSEGQRVGFGMNTITKSPSFVEASIPKVTMDIYFNSAGDALSSEDNIIGYMVMENQTMKKGDNLWHRMPMYMSAETPAQHKNLADFFQSYVNYAANGMSPDKNPMTVSLRGRSSPVSYLERAFKRWTTDKVNLYGLPVPMVGSASVSLNPITALISPKTDASMQLVNPMDIQVWIGTSNFDVTVCKT